MGPRAGLDGCGKSHPHRGSIPGPSPAISILHFTSLVSITCYFDNVHISTLLRRSQFYAGRPKQSDCTVCQQFPVLMQQTQPEISNSPILKADGAQQTVGGTPNKATLHTCIHSVGECGVLWWLAFKRVVRFVCAVCITVSIFRL